MRICFICSWMILMSRIGLCQLSNLDSFQNVIKQPDEFVDIISNVSCYPDSLAYFSQLFDLDKLRNGEISEEMFHGFWEALKTQDSLNFRFDNSDWMARLNCTAIYKGNPESMILELVPIYEKKLDFISWRIVGATAEFIRPKQDTLKMISPVSHNMDFLQIGKSFDRDGSNLEGMINTKYQFDDLLGLVVLFREGIIKFQSLDHMLLEYRDANGYKVQIEEIISNGKVSGWGITSLIKN